MKIKELALGTLSRILRYAGILLLIYISMVFYLALTERRNAFPRAITHNEARAAIADKAKNISCTLDDGTVLEGFIVGNEQNNVLLYYPDADEDAAQFLAELDSLPGYAAATFNYRGSGENKGTPSEETFVSDAQMIHECATQINGRPPKIVAGRGTGARRFPARPVIGRSFACGYGKRAMSRPSAEDWTLTFRRFPRWTCRLLPTGPGTTSTLGTDI